MSDAESREGSQEVDLSQLDTSEQLEPSADGQVEDSTQEPTEEVFETVELNDLVGETKAESDDEKDRKEKNKLYASNRVMSKKLKQLEEQVLQGNIPSEFAFNPDDIGEEPSIKDYQARLYDEFDGSEAIMILVDYLNKEYKIETYIMRPGNKNLRGIRAYEKCGFVKMDSWDSKLYYEDADESGNGDYGIDETVNMVKVISDT